MYWKCQCYDLCFRMRSRCITQFNLLVFFFFFLVKDVKESVSFFFVENGGKKKQGWGVAVLVGVPSKDDAFKTHPMNLLNERTLKGTFFGNYKPRSDIPNVVEKYMKKVPQNLPFFPLSSF